MGKVVIEEVELFREVVGQLNKKFIAFDTETTGFSPYKDRIIELGAVLFINNKETAYFNSLVKTDVKNSYHAYKVNKISEEMLEKLLPKEKFIDELTSTGSYIEKFEGYNMKVEEIGNYNEKTGIVLKLTGNKVMDGKLLDSYYNYDLLPKYYD